MLVMVVKCLFGYSAVIVILVHLSSCLFVILTERKDLFPRSFRCFVPLQHDKYLVLSSCLFVILRTCHLDGTEGSLSPFF